MTKDRYIYEALTLRSFMLMLENMDDPLTLIKLSVGSSMFNEILFRLGFKFYKIGDRICQSISRPIELMYLALVLFNIDSNLEGGLIYHGYLSYRKIK